MFSIHLARGKPVGKSEAGLLVLLWTLLFLPSAASSGSSARLVVPDILAQPEQDIRLEAYLVRAGLMGMLSPAVQGELVQFFDGTGNLLGERLTDASGLARLSFRSAESGISTFTARLAENPRFKADPATVRVFIQKKACPFLFVFIEGALTPNTSAQRFFRKWDASQAAPGSKEAIEKICASFNLVYLTLMPRFSSWQARQWLDEQGYPQAPLQSPLGSSVEVELGEEAPASTKELEALWTDRSLPAHLVTGDRSLAEAAAGKGFLVYLIVEPVEGTPSSGQGAGEREPAGLRILESWREFEPNRSEPKGIGQPLTGKGDPNSPKKGRERPHEKPQGNPAES